MLRDLFAVIAVSQLSMCQTTPVEEPTPNGLECSDYQYMVDVELLFLQSCETDSECSQPLDGFGCGCETDVPLLNGSAHSYFIYQMRDEAELDGCTIEIPTDCSCSPDAVPVCDEGMCGWSE